MEKKMKEEEGDLVEALVFDVDNRVPQNDDDRQTAIS